MKRLLALLLGGICWLLVAASVAILAGGLVGRPVLLAAVPTGSMQPVLQPGDLILVLPLWGAPPRPGDIAVFRTEPDPSWVVHRIIGGTPEEGFITRGDNNPVPDPQRVFPRDMAGLVPVWRDRPVRVPHLGLLSPGTGPLANPLVAGGALVAGIYLLAADAGAALRSLRRGRRRWRRLLGRPQAVLPLYLGLAGGAFVITFMVSISLSSVQPSRYEVVAEVPANARMAGRLIAGVPQVDRVRLANPSPLPLVAAFSADDPHLQFAPAWAVVWPGRPVDVTVTLQSDVPGPHEARIRQALYLPLLPPAVLEALAGVHWHLPAVATALVPALAVLALAATDRRVWRQWRVLILGLRVRLHV